MKKLLFLIFLCYSAGFAAAQSREQLVQVEVVPDHADWVYRVGEQAKFSVAVKLFGHPVKHVPVKYTIGPENRDPVIQQEAVLENGTTQIKGGTLKEPGFIRCTVKALVEGVEYEGYATVGFDPLELKPTIPTPADFKSFWQEEVDKMRSHPLTYRKTLLPALSTDRSDVYEVEFSGISAGTHFYSILTVPKKEGKYPVVLMLPGAGVWPEFGANEEYFGKDGAIVLDFRIHGIPLTLDKKLYEELRKSALVRYWNAEFENRENFYMKKAYLGTVRAVDLIYELPEFDGENLVATGGSQGGALTIVVAGLDKRIKAIAAFFPAFCDLTGDLNGRTGGWPRPFRPENKQVPGLITEEKISTAAYYDVVNFARLVECPGFYSWGYNDRATPPTSTFAAYNVVKAPKELLPVPIAAHHTFPEQKAKGIEWLQSRIHGKEAASAKEVK